MGTEYTSLVGPSSLSVSTDDDTKMLAGFSRGAYQVRALAGIIHEVSRRNHLLQMIDSYSQQVGLLQESEVKEERFDQLASHFYCARVSRPTGMS